MRAKDHQDMVMGRMLNALVPKDAEKALTLLVVKQLRHLRAISRNVYSRSRDSCRCAVLDEKI